MPRVVSKSLVWQPATNIWRINSLSPVIPNSTEKDQRGMEKCGVLHFGGNNVSVHAYRAISASAEGAFCFVEQASSR